MFEHCLYFNTTSLARQLEREWSRAFKPLGITPPQAFMLRVILEKPSITGTELSLVLNISKATCSRTAEGLIKLGFIKKTQADQDSRSYELHPTQKAWNIRTSIIEASKRVTNKIKKIIGTEAFKNTVTNLKYIRSSMV